jgi:uncharacterized membrane protein
MAGLFAIAAIWQLVAAVRGQDFLRYQRRARYSAAFGSAILSVAMAVGAIEFNRARWYNTFMAVSLILVIAYIGTVVSVWRERKRVRPSSNDRPV